MVLRRRMCFMRNVWIDLENFLLLLFFLPYHDHHHYFYRIL